MPATLAQNYNVSFLLGGPRLLPLPKPGILRCKSRVRSASHPGIYGGRSVAEIQSRYTPCRPKAYYTSRRLVTTGQEILRHTFTFGRLFQLPWTRASFIAACNGASPLCTNTRLTKTPALENIWGNVWNGGSLSSQKIALIWSSSTIGLLLVFLSSGDNPQRIRDVRA